MNSCREKYFSCVLLILLQLVPGMTRAQTDNTGSDSIRSHHSLYAAAGYGSNMIYLGSTISSNQPYIHSSVIYGFNDEFYASLTAVHLAGVKPFLTLASGTLNYSHTFNSWFDISASIAGYKFISPLHDSVMNDFMYGDITLGFDWKLIYSKLSAGGLVSSQNAAYFQLNNSRYFQTPEFFNGKMFISFDPYINLLFGTMVKYDTIGVVTPAAFGRWKSKKHETGYLTSYSKVLGLLETDIGLPVSFNFERFTIEAETGYMMPAYDDPQIAVPKGFFFLLTGYLKII